MNGPVWAIVVAAGRGSRFGGAKQYQDLGGQRVLDWSLKAARTVATGVVVVVPPWRAADAEPLADVLVPGGSTRSDSVRAGLAAVPDDAAVILVHDAARPLATPRLFAAVVAALGDDVVGAVPGIAVVDSLRSRDGRAVDREALVAVQTPQAFTAAALRSAHGGGGEASDDATLVEQAGGTIAVVPGEVANRKITDPADLAAAEGLLV